MILSIIMIHSRAHKFLFLCTVQVPVVSLCSCLYFRSFPRLVGECGGKNFHLVHESADLESVINGTLRSAFEYSGQKCSACSRAYVPESVWHQVLCIT